MDNEIKIRMASETDAKQLVKIYEPYVLSTAVSFEYTVPTVEEFTQRIIKTKKRFPYLVAVCGDEILGYTYVSPFKTRAAYDWAVETSIYVKMGVHSQGIGTKLYEALEKILKSQHIINLNACIAYPNPESIAFHEKHGYHKVAHFTKCGYKFDSWYDIIWMEKMIGEHEANPPKVLNINEVENV